MYFLSCVDIWFSISDIDIKFLKNNYQLVCGIYYANLRSSVQGQVHS